MATSKKVKASKYVYYTVPVYRFWIRYPVIVTDTCDECGSVIRRRVILRKRGIFKTGELKRRRRKTIFDLMNESYCDSLATSLLAQPTAYRLAAGGNKPITFKRYNELKEV